MFRTIKYNTYRELDEVFKNIDNFGYPQLIHCTDTSALNDVHKRMQSNDARFLDIINIINTEKLTGINIIDFGGRHAVNYFYIKHMLPTIQLSNYFIIELPLVCEHCNQVFSNYQDIKYYNNVNEIPIKCDIFYTDASLHYVSDEIYQHVLEFIKNSKIEILVFVRMPVTNDNTYFTTQNYKNYHLPYRIINEKLFIDQICNLGYELKINQFCEKYPYHISHNFVFYKSNE